MQQIFNYENFYNNAQTDFKKAFQLIRELENLLWHEMHLIGSNKFNDGEQEFIKERLADVLKSIQLKLEFAYEFLELKLMRKSLRKEISKYEESFGDLIFIQYLDVFYSPVLSILEKHINALTSHLKLDKSKIENANSKLLLEQIIKGIPKMLTDRKIQPSNEMEVRTEVYYNLIHVFPDTVKEIPISKVSKTYKPDIGIRSLKSAIEYKFVDSEKEAKIAIGGIFEDIQGYNGSKDWKTFYAVIYMTDNFFTQAQIEAEFKMSKAPHSWKPIIVFGKGQRKSKKNIL